MRLTEKSIERISFHLKEERPAPFIRPLCVSAFPFWALTDLERGKKKKIHSTFTFAPDG